MGTIYVDFPGCNRPVGLGVDIVGDVGRGSVMFAKCTVGSLRSRLSLSSKEMGELEIGFIEDLLGIGTDEDGGRCVVSMAY